MVNFVILSTQRSGSTFFSTFIGSHPKIDSHGEIFIKKKHDKYYQEDRFYNYYSETLLRNFLVKIRLHSLIVPSYLKNFLDNPTPGTKAIGFKLMYNQEKLCKLSPSKLNKMKFLIIHFIRLNVLKIFISREFLYKSNIAHSTKEISRVPIKLNANKLVYNLDNISSEIDLYKRRLKNCNVLEVHYEKFVEDPNSEAKRVLKFLKIDYDSHLKSNLVKLSNNRLENVIINFNEIKKLLKNTKYEKYIY